MMEIKSGVYIFINNDWLMLLFSIYIFAHYTDVLTVHDCPADEATLILHLSLISLKASVQNKLSLNRFDISHG